MPLLEGVQLLLVLGWMDGAGGIHQATARFQQGQECFQQLALQFRQPVHRLGGDSPAGIGVAGQGAEAGAGGIDQEAIEAAQQLGLELGQGEAIGLQGVDRAQPQAFSVGDQAPQARA
jgi:hypothetical protein